MKQALRQKCLKNLKQQNALDKQERDSELLRAFMSLPEYREARTIATYLSMEGEVDTIPLIRAALADGKRVVVPKVLSREEMVFLEYDEKRLEKSKFGTWEPTVGEPISKVEIDLIHVPGLVFNERGFRIGYGGGFYDRYLQNYKGKTVSTIYAFQHSPFLEEKHDIAVQEVICK